MKNPLIENTIKVGDRVKFINDVDGDNEFNITVVEINGDRCIIQIDINEPIQPTSVVNISELTIL